MSEVNVASGVTRWKTRSISLTDVRRPWLEEVGGGQLDAAGVDVMPDVLCGAAAEVVDDTEAPLRTPFSSSWSTSREPMNEAPPVTRTLLLFQSNPRNPRCNLCSHRSQHKGCGDCASSPIHVSGRKAPGDGLGAVAVMALGKDVSVVVDGDDNNLVRNCEV